MSNDAQLADWELLAQVSQVYRGVSDSFMDRVDMHRGQAVLLCTVCKQPGLTQSEVAERLSIQGATVTNMLQKMEEAGLVVRHRDQDDNRLVRVFATPEGIRMEQLIDQQFRNMQEMIFDGMSPDERANLRRLLEKLLNTMNAHS